MARALGARAVAQLTRAGLDIVLPPRCLACGALTGGGGALCPACWEDIAFVPAPICRCCGIPVEAPDLAPDGEGTVALPCGCRGLGYDRARAALCYGGTAARLITAFKHADRQAGLPTFAGWLAGAGRVLLTEAELIVPVPLHWMRLLQRRDNQAALLARGLGKRMGVPVAVDALQRMRATPSQGRHSRTRRQQNVRGAFRLHPRRGARVQGRRVLLVDDVMTSGATVGEAARTLRRGGARGVDVLTLARVTDG